MVLDLDKLVHYRCLTPIRIKKTDEKIIIICPVCEIVLEEIDLGKGTFTPNFSPEDAEKIQVHLWVAIPTYITHIFSVLGKLPLIRRIRRKPTAKTEATPIIVN